MSDIKEYCTSRGFNSSQVDDCIEEYEMLNVWQVNQAKTTVTFI
jgi:DNA replication licensing factor MCM7